MSEEHDIKAISRRVPDGHADAASIGLKDLLTQLDGARRTERQVWKESHPRKDHQQAKKKTSCQ